MLRSTSPYSSAWSGLQTLALTLPRRLGGLGRSLGVRTNALLFARRQRQQVIQESLFLMRFWAWYRCVPPHYLGSALRHNLAKLLLPQLQVLHQRMPDSEFVRLQRQRLTQLRDPITAVDGPAGRGARAEFVDELQLLVATSPLRGQGTIQSQLAALAMRLRVDGLTHDAHRALLLRRPHQARAALTAALAEVYDAGLDAGDGAARAEAEALRAQLAGLRG